MSQTRACLPTYLSASAAGSVGIPSGCHSPRSALRRLAFEFAKGFELAEGKTGKNVPVALLDDLGVEIPSVGKNDVAQRSPVPVPCVGPGISLESHGLAVSKVTYELGGLHRETLDTSIAVPHLRSVDSDEADRFHALGDLHLQRIAIDDVSNPARLRGA